MHLPHTLLIVGAIVLWGASRRLAPSPPARVDDVPALAIAGSAYGSLLARTMRGPLYAYWHGGEELHNPTPAKKPSPPSPAPAPAAASPAPAPAAPAPPPAGAGVFSRRRLAAGQPVEPPPPPPAGLPAIPAQETAPAATSSLLDRSIQWISRLEAGRTKRPGQGQMTLSQAHLRYVNAAAGWRLRLAYALDPGDASLYEILNQHAVTEILQQQRTVTPETEAQARASVKALARRAIDYARTERAGLAEALTAAGAAVNLLNNALETLAAGASTPADVVSSWNIIEENVTRYQTLRATAVAEGWWEGIPLIRRQELDEQAQNLIQLSGKIREYLFKKSFLPPP